MSRKQLSALRRAVAVPAGDVPLRVVVPVFVPGTLATPKWLGPIMALKVPGLAVTWAALMPGQTLRYVSHPMAAAWTKRQRDWRTKAMENLVAMTPQLSTHSFTRANGQCYGLVMLHDDGVGPSRLFLDVWIEEVFPSGYACAIPERSCAVVVSDEATKKERAKVETFVRKVHRKGPSPLLPGFFRPDALRPRRGKTL